MFSFNWESCNVIPFSRYFSQSNKQNVSLKFLFHSLKQWPTGEKEGKTEIQKFEYLNKRKSILDEIKGYDLVVKWKIVDISFTIYFYNEKIQKT